MTNSNQTNGWDFTAVIEYQRTVNAEVATEVLRYAARDWRGDPEVAAWLNERADQIAAIGSWDREAWPANTEE